METKTSTKKTDSVQQLQKKPTAPEWLYDEIKSLVESSNKTLLLFITILVYFLLTILSATDSDLVLNKALTLPVLNVSVPINLFCFLTPILITILFSYLNINLISLENLVKRLNLEFTDADRRCPTSVLLNTSDYESSALTSLKKGLTSLSQIWLLPLSFMATSFWYIKKHEIFLSYVINLFPLFSLVIIGYFLRKSDIPRKRTFLHHPFIAVAALTLLYQVVVLLYVIPNANAGSLYINPNKSNLFASVTSLQLEYQVLVKEQKSEYDTYWLNLEDAHLEGADLTHSVLKQANLRNAHLNGSNLKNTTFRGALLEGADFRFAHIEGTDFSYAKMRGIRNIDLRELCRARTLFNAKLDSSVLQYLKRNCPLVLSEESQNW